MPAPPKMILLIPGFINAIKKLRLGQSQGIVESRLLFFWYLDKALNWFPNIYQHSDRIVNLSILLRRGSTAVNGINTAKQLVNMQKVRDFLIAYP